MVVKTNHSLATRTGTLFLLIVTLVITGLAAFTAPVMADAPAPLTSRQNS